MANGLLVGTCNYSLPGLTSLATWPHEEDSGAPIWRGKDSPSEVRTSRMSRNGEIWNQKHIVDAGDKEEEKQVIEAGWERNQNWAERDTGSKDDSASLGDSAPQEYEQERGTWPDGDDIIVPEDDFVPRLSPWQGPASEYQYVEFCRPGTLHYRMLFLDRTGKEISPWHSIPLHGRDGLLSFICKSPLGTWAEYEVAENEEYNPLRIRNRRGLPAHFAENTSWNVGFLSGTYGDPDQPNEEYGGLAMDGKPLEVFDIGRRVAVTGDVYLVKPLAAFAVIQDRMLAWKIVAIAADDVIADRLHTMEDLQAFSPGVLDNIRDWLRTYHCIEPADSELVFGLNERPIGLDSLLQIVAGAHGAWQLYSCDHPNHTNPTDAPLGRDATEYEILWRKHNKGIGTDCIDLYESKATSTLKYERAWSNLSDIDGMGGGGAGEAGGVVISGSSNPSSPIDGRARTGKGKAKELLSFLRPTTSGARRAGEQMMKQFRSGGRREAGRSSSSIDSCSDSDFLAEEGVQQKKNIFRALMPKHSHTHWGSNPKSPGGSGGDFVGPGGYLLDTHSLRELTLQGTVQLSWTRSSMTPVPPVHPEPPPWRQTSMGHTSAKVGGGGGGGGPPGGHDKGAQAALPYKFRPR